VQSFCKPESRELVVVELVVLLAIAVSRFRAATAGVFGLLEKKLLYT